MYWDDPAMKDLDRGELERVLRALRKAEAELLRLVGDALPGSYAGNGAFGRFAWSAQIRVTREPDVGVTLELYPPHHPHGGLSIAELVAIKVALRADDLGVDGEGRVWAHYDID